MALWIHDAVCDSDTYLMMEIIQGIRVMESQTNNRLKRTVH